MPATPYGVSLEGSATCQPTDGSGLAGGALGRGGLLSWCLLGGTRRLGRGLLHGAGGPRGRLLGRGLLRGGLLGRGTGGGGGALGGALLDRRLLGRRLAGRGGRTGALRRCLLGGL